MAFFNSAITVLQTLVIALGAGLGIWGALTCWRATATTTRRKEPGHEAAHGWRRRGPHRHHSGSSALRSLRLIGR